MLMRRWIMYFVKQYPTQILLKDKAYLDSKKTLTRGLAEMCMRGKKRGYFVLVSIEFGNRHTHICALEK